MKIAVDVLSIRSDGSAGGATGYALELIKGFAAIKENKVLVLCADWNQEYIKKVLPDNVQFCCVMSSNMNTAKNAFEKISGAIKNYKKKNVLRSKGVDILCCPFSAATCREKGIPTVSTILDIQHEYYPHFFTTQELNNRRAFYREIVDHVERVVCISDYTKKTFCDKYGFPEDRADTVYIAVQNRLQEEDLSILGKLNVEKDGYIVYPANFWEHKNHKLLLMAYSYYVNNGGILKLVLTGNPLSEKKFYDDFISQAGLEGKVMITGYVSNAELYAVLNNAKGLIYPSLFEGFGIPVVEAMHMKKLIACSNMTSLPEIGCDAIYYFDPRRVESIQKGIEYIDENHMDEQIVRSYDEKLKEYRASVMIDKYMEIFKDTLSNRQKYFAGEGIERIEGIYSDKWASKNVKIALIKKKGGKFRMVAVPPEHMKLSDSIKVHVGGRIDKYSLKPKQHFVYECDIDSENFKLNIVFGRVWMPLIIARVKDIRRLTYCVKELVYIDAKGEEHDL